MQKSDCIYHGCFTKNRDGSNRLIVKNNGHLFPTNNPFWKYPQDIPNGVRTQSQEKKIKIQLKKVNIIDILDKKISAIFGDGQKWTNQKYAY